MLCSGEIQAKGVFPPEAVVDPERFLEELAKRDIRFEEIEAVSEGI
jgi:saccharopine dehydrogenase-like NADP-dependent oxidoreductase